MLGDDWWVTMIFMMFYSDCVPPTDMCTFCTPGCWIFQHSRLYSCGCVTFRSYFLSSQERIIARKEGQSRKWSNARRWRLRSKELNSHGSVPGASWLALSWSKRLESYGCCLREDRSVSWFREYQQRLLLMLLPSFWRQLLLLLLVFSIVLHMMLPNQNKKNEMKERGGCHVATTWNCSHWKFSIYLFFWWEVLQLFLSNWISEWKSVALLANLCSCFC